MTRKRPLDLSDSIDDGSRPLSTPYTTLLSTNTINRYLDGVISEDADLIVSTVRKGSWIIENYLRETGKHIRNITSEEPFPIDLALNNVILFDDSIHSGKTILEAYDEIPLACNTKVCCIAINEDAMNKLRTKGVKDISYLRMFKDYEEFRMDGKEEKELDSDCQSYYYSHFIIPYISGLSFNYSPDYVSLSIRIDNDTSGALKGITDAVSDSINDIISEYATIYRDTKVIKSSAELSIDLTSKILTRICKSQFEIDMSKIRISATAWKGYTEVVITPIVSFRIKSDDDLSDLLTRCSDDILTQLEKRIRNGIEKRGFRLIGSSRFQAKHGVRWEQ